MSSSAISSSSSAQHDGRRGGRNSSSARSDPPDENDNNENARRSSGSRGRGGGGGNLSSANSDPPGRRNMTTNETDNISHDDNDEEQNSIADDVTEQENNREGRQEAGSERKPRTVGDEGASLVVVPDYKDFSTSNHQRAEATVGRDSAARTRAAEVLYQEQGARPIDELMVHAIPISSQFIHIPKDFICPISGAAMQDPVLLVPSGVTYDKKHLCQSLLIHPHVDPFTQRRYDQKLTYCDNLLVQRMLVRKLGTSAYSQYDDSGFRAQYNAVCAAKSNDPASQLPPTELYHRLEGLMFGMNRYRIDMDRAFELLNTAPNDPIAVAYQAWFLDPAAYSIYALCCPKNGTLSSDKWQKAHDLGLHQLAKSGNKWAQALEGRRHLLHLDDPLSASIWYQESTDQDHAVSQWALGNLYQGGRGVDQNFSLAVDFYMKAAGHGHSAAQTNLGAMYYYGNGVEEDFAVAVDNFRKAAEQGDDQGQYNLAIMYDRGDGVEQDESAALFWYERAAEQGHLEAMEKLGRAATAKRSSPGVRQIS